MLGSLVGLLLLVVGLGVAAYALVDVPAPGEEATYQTTTVYWGNADGTRGEVMGELPGLQRTIVDTSTLPDYVGNAVVASEDRSFWTNRGISVTGIARAFVNNVRGGDTQGASTLTQQYVKNYYTERSTIGYVGKAKEALLALKISRQESKDQVLDRYLNTVYFGRDTYGIQEASQAYFGVDAAQLTISQAALLAGIIPSPNNWEPATNPERAQQRWERVLDLMTEDGWITAADRDAAVFPETVVEEESQTYAGPTGYLLKLVEAEAQDRLGMTEDELKRAGLAIDTTFDKAAQDQAVATATSLWDGTLAGGSAPDPAARLAIVSVDPADGGVVALYGGQDYLADARDAATYLTAQAASTFKPFTLVAALEQGIPLTTTYNGNSPQEPEGWGNPGEDVSNFGGTDYGRIDLVRATQDSVNTVYAQLNVQVGPAATADVAQRAGIRTAVMPDRASNVLGIDFVHPLDMADAFATFAAQGFHSDPFVVRSATYSDGTVAYTAQSTRTQVFAADVMADATYAMTQVVERGTGQRNVGRVIDVPVAGKTGSSTDNLSAWFVGYTPTIATAVVLTQYDEGGFGKNPVTVTPFGGVREITGSTWPAVLWATYMDPVLDQPRFAAVRDFPPRAGVGGRATPTTTPSATPTPTPSATPTAEPAAVTVPSGLVGTLQADAVAALQGAGLAAEVVAEPSAEIAAGRVVRLEPGAGAALAAGDAVRVVVSSGAPAAPAPTAPPATTAPTPAPGGEDAGDGAGGGAGDSSGAAPTG
ncbi:transglycosylase domain-containing protein [Cellulomonas marina]|uniref:Membrane carboxypeptidase (Penicillin-binding protein) n=1 Tax=Cellulomonas marina TaxID=988821 RepID=A0A1I0YI78_9CELL|nr:transglycosylase domain-containing protein [Cellulomonas marina]GIG28681.1 hypothetical protein Cma02nite_12810 [Cellulomonas marina]SFB12587.1 Membrane carboxypeptidase (penicillin-binding protein) [Cellulomonas marina]